MIASRRFGFAVLFVAVLVAVTLPDAAGQPFYPRTSNNSVLDINLDPLVHDTVYNWVVEGVDHLVEFSNWYRVGGGREFPLATVPVTSVDDTQPDRLIVTHTDPSNRFTVEVTYGVSGGPIGSGFSRMGECVTITNHTGSLLAFHLFEYMNLDLDNTPGDDTAFRITPSRLQQDDITSGTTFNVSYGTSSHHEIAYSPSILSRLNNGSSTTLTDVPAALFTPIGQPGDMEFALQFDIFLPGGGSHTICKDCELQMYFVPEPASWALVLIAGMTVGRIRIRRQRKS